MIERAVLAATVNRHGDVTRRDFLRTVTAGAAAGIGLGWHDLLLAEAPALHQQGKAVIVLWMQGAPTQFETFDPKPGSSDGAQTKVISTAVPGIAVADFWPNVARQMKDLTIIRSMTSKEGNHQRATYTMHTGYVPSGSVKHPGFGSLVVNEIAPKNYDLPSFVSISGPSVGSGYLPVRCAPFRIPNPGRLPENVAPPVASPRYQERLDLLGKLETGYAKAGAKQQVEDHRILYQQAARLVTSPRLKAFDLRAEKGSTAEAYGSSAFGQGCLLARRLIEAGITYVEVQLGGWDTHQDNHDRVQRLAGQCDPAFAALIRDLKQRGLLQKTLVLWMGEFGRTPKVNPRGGRDHYPRAFTAVVAGGGLSAGKVVGKTSDSGSDVVQQPVTINDLFCTFCKSLGINPRKENQTPLGRPIKIVDGGSAVKELLS